MLAMHPRLIAMLLVALTALTASTSPSLAQDVYELGPDDEWKLTQSPDSNAITAQLASARTVLAQGRSQRAYNLAVRWIKRHPGSPALPLAYLVKGDALVAMGDYYDSLYDFEYIARRYPGSPEFGLALEREFEIAQKFAAGLRRKWLGMRIASATDEAEEIFIRVQERMPGSQLAERAGMALADLYFSQRRMNRAAEAYAIFVQKYPRSPSMNLARRRLIYANIAAFKGPYFDIVGLLEAKAELKQLQANRPAEAEQVGAGALIARIQESEATKMLTTARWYERTNDPIAAEITVRSLVRRFPRSAATATALQWIPSVLTQLPPLVKARTPDYQLLRTTLLGVASAQKDSE